MQNGNQIKIYICKYTKAFSWNEEVFYLAFSKGKGPIGIDMKRVSYNTVITKVKVPCVTYYW